MKSGSRQPISFSSPSWFGFAMSQVLGGQGDASGGRGGKQGQGTRGMRLGRLGQRQGWAGARGLARVLGRCMVSMALAWTLLPPEPRPCLPSPTPAWGMPQTPQNPADFQHRCSPDCRSLRPQKGGSGVQHPRAPGQSELLLPNELLLFSAAADKSN